VSHGRTVEQIHRVIGATIEVPELLLIPAWFQRFVLEYLQKIRRLGKSRARRSRRAQAGGMAGKLPAGRAAHGEASYQQAGFSDRIMFADFVQGLEKVHFAGEFVG